jgi:hypothetical protein
VAVWVYPTSAERQSILGKTNMDADLDASYSLSLGLTTVSREPWWHVQRNGTCLDHEEFDRAGSPQPVSLNRWSFLAATWDGQTMRLYVDGSLAASQAAPPGPIDPCFQGVLRFGVWWSADPMYFQGRLDDVRIYDRALDEAEIKTLFGE